MLNTRLTRSLRLLSVNLWMKSRPNDGYQVLQYVMFDKSASTKTSINYLYSCSDDSQYYSSSSFLFFLCGVFFFCVLLPRSGFAPMLVSVKWYSPPFCTTKFILVFFVPMLFVTSHSYNPLSVVVRFLMVRISPLTSVLAKGNAWRSLVQLDTGVGNPSARQTSEKSVLSNGMVSDGGLFTKIGAAKNVKFKVLGVRLSANSKNYS